jgi:hypothetical protein
LKAKLLKRAMNIRTGTILASALVALSFAAAVWAIPPMPRRSPEFTILEPSPTGGPDKQLLLSSTRGKVVLLAFIHTTCQHCQAYSQMMLRLHKDLGPGFQPVAITWNPNAKMLTPGFVKQFGLDFPVGYSDAYEPIMNFMGFSVMDRPVVPLAVVIDKKGMIRAQSQPDGEANLSDEAYLRTFLTGLLRENSPGKK